MKHTDTRIYHQSIELARDVAKAITEFPRGYAFLADQLRRATASVTLNFAEGCGKESRRDRRRFFVQARGSANEVVAGIDIVAAMRAVKPGTHECIADRADHIAAMLSNYR